MTPAGRVGERGGELAGLYLHVPFCRAICPYCDFAVSLGDEAKKSAYVASLEREIELVGESWPSPAFDTIYFGGGTPSALGAESLEAIVEHLREHLPVGSDAELYFEANPEDVTAEALESWRALGVSFMSLGVQSFDDERLRFLGRAHDGGRAREAVRRARAAGFRTVSLDLIFGLPDDRVEVLDRELDAIVELEADHVSCYQLTIHAGTAFGQQHARGRLDELPEGRQADLYQRIQERLGEAGVEPYEVSNFSRGRRHRSRHNQKYWRHAPYLGLGPSAHSFDGERRWWNLRGVGSWSRALERNERAIDGTETLTSNQLVLEAVMLGLRTRDGIDLAELEERHGVDLVEPTVGAVASLVEAELIRRDGARVRPTHRGMAVADALVREIAGCLG